MTEKENANVQSLKLHRDFNQFQLVFKQQTWKKVFMAMSPNLAANLFVEDSEATRFALNFSIKEEVKLI